jgi:hypothetical protein
MQIFKELDTKNKSNNKNKETVISAVTHIADWTRTTTPTSPHLFKDGNELDKQFITKSLESEKYAMFLRKVSPTFPDTILREYIYEKTKEKDGELPIVEPNLFIYNRYKYYLVLSFYYGVPLCIILCYLLNILTHFYKLK